MTNDYTKRQNYYTLNTIKLGTQIVLWTLISCLLYNHTIMLLTIFCVHLPIFSRLICRGRSLETRRYWMTWFNLCRVCFFSTGVIGSGGIILSYKHSSNMKWYRCTALNNKSLLYFTLMHAYEPTPMFLYTFAEASE